jgi:hypothetical protein
MHTTGQISALVDLFGGSRAEILFLMDKRINNSGLTKKGAESQGETTKLP